MAWAVDSVFDGFGILWYQSAFRALWKSLLSSPFLSRFSHMYLLGFAIVACKIHYHRAKPWFWWIPPSCGSQNRVRWRVRECPDRRLLGVLTSNLNHVFNESSIGSLLHLFDVSLISLATCRSYRCFWFWLNLKVLKVTQMYLHTTKHDPHFVICSPCMLAKYSGKYCSTIRDDSRHYKMAYLTSSPICVLQKKL